MTTSFSTALKQGYSVMYALQIEGLPYIFVENKFPKITADTSATAAYYTTVEGLIVDESSNLGIEIDRETGVARGQAATFTLAFQALSDAGYLDDIFSRPSGTEISRLTGDLTQSSTTINVVDTSGFASAPGAAYIGKEHFTYSGKTSNSFTGVVRGQVGNKYVHHANSPSTYGMVSAKPVIWRGRYVTLWEHLVTPDGRLLSSSWMDTDDWGREVWKGYIEEAAMPGVTGMEFTCLPLVRKLSEPVGLEVEWKVNRYDIRSSYTGAALKSIPVLYLEESDELDLHFKYNSATTDVKVTGFNSSVDSPFHVMDKVCAEILGTSGDIGVCYVGLIKTTDLETFTFYLQIAGNSSALTEAYLVNHLEKGIYWIQAQKFLQIGSHPFGIPVVFRNTWADEDVLPWLVLTQLTGSGAQDYTIPATGLGFLNSGNVQEAVEWADGAALSTNSDFAKLRIDKRAVGNTPLADPFNEETTLKSATGYIGTLEDGMRTLLESSGGAGHFGTYDTLDLGFGLAIPSGYINEASFTETELSGRDSKAISPGRASFEDLYGGWLALQGNCVIQKRQSDGTVKLDVVKNTVGEFSDAAASVIIEAEDVILDKIERLNIISSPNEVVVKTSSEISKNAPDVLVRDVPKVQVEGAMSWEMSAPGIGEEDAITRAQALIALSDSYYSLRIAVAPWVDIHPGDLTILKLDSHPLLYDYDQGQRGASNVAARCIGVEKALVEQVQYCTFLLFGSALPPVLLAPTVTVGSKAGDTVTLGSDEGKWFAADDLVQLYTEGGEATEAETLTISSISGDALTFTTTPSSWVAAGTRITYPRYTVATTLQDDYMYNVAGKRFF